MTGGTGPAGYGEPAEVAVGGEVTGTGATGSVPGSAAVVGRPAVLGPDVTGSGAGPRGTIGRLRADMVPVSPRKDRTIGSSTFPSAKQRLASAQQERAGSSVPRSR